MAGTVTELPSKPRKRAPKKPKEPEEFAPQPEQPTVSYVRPSTSPFPPWPKGGGRQGFCKPQEMMDYWAGLPPEFIARTNFYVNREMPKLDRLRELSPEAIQQIKNKDRRYPAKYIDKPNEPWEDCSDLRMAILRRYGSGDFKLFLNDAGVTSREKVKDPDLSSRNLCKTFVSFWDSDYPPILDPSRPDKGIGILDLAHPANQSYLSELRAKGILPDEKKEEDDVPNEVMNKLAEKVDSLADKVAVHETDRLVERIAEKVNPGGAQNGASTLVDLLRAAKEMQPPPPPIAAPVSNGMAETLQLVQTIMAMKADNPMAEMYKAQMDLMREERARDREENQKLQAELRAAANAKADDSGGFESMLDKLEKVAPKVQGLLGLGGEKLTDVVHGRKRSIWEELALQTIPDIVRNAAPMLPMLAGRFLGGAAAANPLAPAAPQAQQQALPPAAPNPMQETQVRVANFLGSNLTPMRKVFEDYLRSVPRDPDEKEAGIIDGSDFAAWVHEYHGAEILKDARSLGSGNILLMFKQSPLWAQLAPYEVKLSEFLDQALRYDPPADEPAATEEVPAEL